YHLIIVLIYETGHVKHLHLSSQTPISSSSVVKLSNFLSLHCVSIVNRTMDIQLQSLDGLSKSEVTFLNQLIDLIHREVASESSRIYLGGKHQLIERLNETNVSAIQTILKYIESNQITDLLDEMVDSSISIKIGHEIEQDVENIAILTRRYEIDHALNGYVAVIGPTAMHYQNVIQLLSRIS
ncbi:HrcA family transcriptional regulator, partial [Staphylococcus chromogenes]